MLKHVIVGEVLVGGGPTLMNFSMQAGEASKVRVFWVEKKNNEQCYGFSRFNSTPTKEPSLFSKVSVGEGSTTVNIKCSIIQRRKSVATISMFVDISTTIMATTGFLGRQIVALETELSS